MVERNEAFGRQMSLAIKHSFSGAEDLTEGQVLDVIQSLGTSEDAEGRFLSKADTFMVAFTQAGRNGLQARGDAQAKALTDIAAFGTSTLNAMKLKQRAYVAGLDRDYAALSPVSGYLRPGDAPVQGRLPVAQSPGEMGVDRAAILRGTEGIYWAFPRSGKERDDSILSCVGVVKVAGHGLVVFGSDVPLKSLVAGLRRNDGYGALGLYSASAVLIGESVAGEWFHQGAAQVMKRPFERGLRLTRSGIYQVEAVGEHFGYLVCGLSYLELLKSVATPAGWIWIVSMTLLFSLLAAAWQWDKRVLAKGHAAISGAFENEILNQLLVRTMPIGLLTVRARDYTVIRTNERVTALLDMRAPMKLPASIETGFRSRYADRTQVGSEIKHFDISRVREEDGQPLFLQVAWVPAHYNGEVVFICAVSDVTAHKLSELEATRAREEAERLVRVRSNFLASVCHEVKTPLNVILGNVDLLPLGKVNEAEADRMKAVHTGAQALRRIVADILDLSRIEAGEMKLAKSAFFPLQCVEGVSQRYVERAISKHIDFHILADPGMGRHAVNGDPDRIAQILDNLLGNAFKFTDAGRVAVRASLILDAPTSAMLTLEVIDSGAGMDERLIERIFTPFAQADGDDRRYAGTGLGLSICATLCSVMGGTIAAKSILHVGSVFTARIPVSIATSQADATNETKGNAIIVSKMMDYSCCLQTWLKDWGWSASVRDEIPSALEVSDAAADVIVLAGGDSGSAMELADRVQVPVIRVAQTVVQRPTNLTEQVIEVTAFNTEALREALQLAIGKRPAEPMQVLAAADKGIGVLALRGSNEGMKRIALVVDDSRLNRELLADQVSSLGYDVLSAASGTEALLILHRNNVDILLTDLDLPGMSGAELFGIVHEENPGLPVVAVSAYDFDSEVEKRLAQGFFDYIAKPVSLERLSRVLQLCDAPAIEESGAHERWRGQTLASVNDFSEIVLRKFRKHARDELAELNRIVGDRDTRALNRWMHQMRGALLLIGNQILANRCLDVEMASKDGDEWSDNWRTAVDDVETGVAALC
ncbi:Sensor histidine kinase RcsC [Paraburkholderia aspalathi]|nr:Sensor histidine kinase RcsC [Paraburkholderia aspalathi]